MIDQYVIFPNNITTLSEKKKTGDENHKYIE